MDIAGVLAAVALFIAIMGEVYLLSVRPEKGWYEGRAAAESVKTLSWRYAVGGAPFSISMQQNDADRLFLQGLQETLQTLARATNIEAPGSGGHQIREEMRSVRQLELAERRRIYERDRIREQQGWYASKGAWNQRRATAWGIALIVLEGLAIGGAAVKAASISPVNLLGVGGAAIAGATAWLHVKQHQNLASAYAIAAHELSLISSTIESQVEEANWAQFVDQAEDAISREHTLWKASRGIGWEPLHHNHESIVIGHSGRGR